jgi:hypothetical protein
LKANAADLVKVHTVPSRETQKMKPAAALKGEKQLCEKMSSELDHTTFDIAALFLSDQFGVLTHLSVWNDSELGR